METLIIVPKAQRQPDNTVYVEYRIGNLGIEDAAYYGNTYSIDGRAIADIIAENLLTARQELLNVLQNMYPDQYI